MANPQYGLPVWGGGGIDPTLGNAGSSLFSTAGHGPPAQQTAPVKAQPTIAYNPVDNMMFVNGAMFKADDYASMAGSPQALSNPPVPKPTNGQWHDVPMASYEGLVNEIKDPSLATVAKRNFQQALYGMQEIGYGAIGAVSGATGATGVQDWAAQGAASAGKEQERFAPFNYQFGTAENDSNVKAFVGAIAQAAPWMVESVLSGLGGALVGLGGRAVLQGAVRKAASNVALSQVEKDALVAASRQVAYRGGIGGIVTSSYGTGVGDVYNESVGAGSPDPTGALLRGIPYGLTDAIPEVGALALGLGKAGSLTKYVGGKKLPTRIGVGAAVGGVGEGVNEAIQEQILIGEHQSIDPSYDPGNRVLQSGLGGAAPGILTGGIVGGAAPKNKLQQKQLANVNVATDILTGTQVNDNPNQPVAAPSTPEAFRGGPAGTGPVDYQKTPGPAAMPPGQMSLLQGDAVPFTQERATAVPSPNWDLQDPYQQFKLASPIPGQNRLQEIQARQGANPDQRAAPSAPDTRTGSLLAGEQLSLLPDPAQVIPRGQQTLMDRRGTGQYTPLAVTSPQQGELKLPKQKAALKKGQTATAVEQPAVAPVMTQPTVQPQTGKAKLKKQASQVGPIGQPAAMPSVPNLQPVAPTALKKSPEVTQAQPTISKAELSPPGRGNVSSANDVEDHFSNERFAQQTLAEAKASKGELQYFNSIKQAITKKPALTQAIRDYVEDVSPGAVQQYDEWSEGNKAHDDLVSRGRRIANTNVSNVSGRMVARTDSTQKAADTATKATAESKLQDLIGNKHNLEAKVTFVAKVKALYAEARKNLGDGIVDHKLSSYFTDGEPNVIRTNNRNVLVPFKVTPESQAEFAQREKALRDEINAVAQESHEEDAAEASRIANDYAADYAADAMSDEALADKWNTNTYVNIHTGEVAQPMTVGSVRLKVGSILSKFKLVPKVQVVVSFDQLPQFIQTALKEKGGTNDISGVSFRDQVYIVASKIYGDDHLRSVLLHEVLGHFGLRSVVDAEVLENLFTDIYHNDPVIHAEADALRDTGRYINRPTWELVEEALAERAAEIPNNIIQRLWEVIKRVLKAIGFNVDANNDIALNTRALLKASNRYVRDGVAASPQGFKASVIAHDVMASVNPTSVTRLTSEEIVMKNIMMGGTNQRRAFKEWVKHSLNPKGMHENTGNMFRGLANRIQSVNQIARHNGGFARFMEVIQRESRRIHELLNQYNDDTKLLHHSSFTPDQQTVLGQLLSQTTRAKLQSLSDSDIRDLKLLVVGADGDISIDQSVLDTLKQKGRFSIQDFAKGIEIQYTIDRALTDADKLALKNTLDTESKQIEDLANVQIAATSDPNLKKDIIRQQKRDIEKAESKYKSALSDGTVQVTRKRREDPIKIDPEGDIWKAYNVARDTLDQAQIDMLLAKHKTHKAEASQVYQDAMRKLQGKTKGEPARVIAAFAKDVSETYRSIMMTNVTVEEKTGRVVIDPAMYGRADAMINSVGRALYKDQALKDLLQYFGTQDHVDKLAEQIHQIRALNEKVSDSTFEKSSWNFIAGLRTQFTELLGMDEAEMYAKRSIAGGHTALRRYGDYEVSIVLHDASGNVITPSENWDNNLMYMRMENGGDAEITAADLNEALKGVTFDVVDESGQSVTATPTAFARAAETIGPLGHKISLYDFMTVADRLGVNMTPQNRETIIKALTKADAKARRSLQRGGNPGEDKDIVRVVAEQLESAAHIVASKENKRELDRLMGDNQAWFGDRAQLEDWTVKRDSSTDPRIKQQYQKMIDRWQLEYGKASKDAYYYKAQANNLREWRDQQSSLIAKEENKILANTKSFVSAAQLGGYVANMASALVQLFTLVTHVPAYLATYNPKTAYGGGFGPRAYTAIVAASRDVGAHDLGKLEKLKAKIDKLNLTANEKDFMLTETKEGVFQAAQFNALMNSKLGTLRMFGQSNRLNNALQKWMQLFSWSEEANRRITGLAAYRLFYERAIQAGEPQATAHTIATAEARQAVYQTQGDYSLLNRPPWARSGVASLLFMYKMFPIITVQLVRNLSPVGRGMFMGTMLLLGGFKSLPFAEDLLDILDGLVQRTGIGTGLTRGNAELALREFVDTFFPGLSPVAARGLLDYMTGASLSSRIGVGDIIPGTGFARAGSELSASDLQGPAGGVVSSLYKMSTEALHGNYSKAMREVPITAAKNIIEGVIYLNDGSILNKRGYTVAKDPTSAETIARFMGFYPERQAQSNEFIQSMKHSVDYAKEIKGDFVSRYVIAKMSGDADKVARINQEVQDWNADAKGTEIEIKGFGIAAGRALVAARRPQIDTFLRSSPTAVRRERDHLKALYGVDD